MRKPCSAENPEHEQEGQQNCSAARKQKNNRWSQGRSVLFVPFTFRPGGNRRLASGGNIPAGLPEPGVSLKGYHTAELVGKACEDGEITLAVPVNGKDFSPYSTVEAGVCGALRQGLVTEALNPKTALFFLAFIPQFIDPSANAFAQFVLLGFVTTLLTSGTDLLVVLAAGPLSRVLRRSPRLQRVQRAASGGTLLALGAYVAVRE